MTRFEEYCKRQRARYGDKFVAPTDRRWIEAFNNGRDYRVKVRTTYPSDNVEDRWGFVSLTAGWIPSFMLMRREGQTGSSDLLDDGDTIIDSKWKGRRT